MHMARVSLVSCSAVLLALALAGPAGAWSKPQRLSPAPGKGANSFSVSSPAAAVEPGGEAVVAWGGSAHSPPPSRAAGELRVAVGRRGRFHAPQRLGRGDDPVVAIGPGGTAVVAWTALPGTVMAALRRPGRRFGRPVTLARGTNLAFGVRVAVARDGAVAVVWHRWGSGRPLRDTAFAALGSGRGLGRGVALATAARIDTLDVAFDAAGTAVLAWVQQEQRGAQPATVAVSRRPPGGAVTPPREVYRGLAYGAQLALEPGGRAGLAWIANYGPESGTFGPIQTALEQPGGAFEAPVVAPAASRARTFAVRAAFGRDQELLALWQERSTGTTIDPGGPLLWSTRSAGAAFGPRGVLATGTVFDPALSPTGDGDAVAAWSDPRLRMARYRSRSGWRALAPPPGVPRRLRGALPTRAIAAAGRQLVAAWRDARARVVASARRL